LTIAFFFDKGVTFEVASILMICWFLRDFQMNGTGWEDHETWRYQNGIGFNHNMVSTHLDIKVGVVVAIGDFSMGY
jgi:hypothetical protein